MTDAQAISGLQSDQFRAINAILTSAGQCVVSGCQVTQREDQTYDLASGVVAISVVVEQGSPARIIAMPFGGAAGVSMPCYLTAVCDVVQRVYSDGTVRTISSNYVARAVTEKPVGESYLEIIADGGLQLPDALAEALRRYVCVTSDEKANWDSKAPSSHVHGDATGSASGFMSNGDKSKLDGVAVGANNYVHPNDANTRHATDAEKAAWNAKAEANHVHTIANVTNLQTTLDGKAAANHAHTDATGSASGFMSKGDKSKLDGVAVGANNYVHPNDANTRHATDAEKAAWNAKAAASHTHTIANVTNLQTTLDGKALAAHTHNSLTAIYETSSFVRKNEITYGSVRITDQSKTTGGKYSDTQLNTFDLKFIDLTGGSGRILASFGPVGITLPSTAKINMPGVLRAGRVSNFGSIVGTSWGAKPCSGRHLSGGKYEITHNIGHTDYYANVTPVSNGSWTKVHGAIIEKTTTYVVVGMYDSGYENTTIDYAFEFMICGRN